ncbi:MAG: HesA/MoeB/ThiF family protein [Endomicrobiaceae bacterium]|nr:HesA/MoeB/ThiF family protein [Endomicrobiaceae bacterium]
MTNEQLERYSRNILLKEVGIKGQQKLLSSKVLVIGAGGLGSSAIIHLAAAGIGTIGIADKDKVELSNLNRQIIHNTDRVGQLKTESAKQTLTKLNPDIKINIYNEISSENISEIISQYDFIIDATDNFETKFLINDACVRGKKPFSHAGIVGFQGQLMTYVPDKGCCYRCVFKEPPAKDCVSSCSKDGVLGAVVGIIGSLQATEAIKYILGIGELLTGYLLTYNALTTEFRKVKLPPPDKDCPACGEK